MKSIADRRALSRKAMTANILSIIGMLILVAGLFIPVVARAYADYSMGVFLAGFAVANIGIYLANRWVKRPRPEEVLDYSLRTRNDQHRLYHYLLPHDHVLLTPSGVIVLQTCALEGEFLYQDGKWRRKFSMSRALRFFVEEPLGDPIAEAQSGAKAIAEMLAETVTAPVPVDAMVIFIHPQADFKVNDAPIPVVRPDRLGKKLPHHEPLDQETWAQTCAALDVAAKVAERKLGEQ